MNRQNIALSGIAMLLIVINHAIQMGLEYTDTLGILSEETLGSLILWALQALGSFAVPIFLFISGSFVAYAARGEPPKLSRKFLQSGLLHILLPYLLWSVIFYLVLFVNRGIQFSLLGYAKQLLVGYPFHFVPLLAFFYLISPILVPIGKRHAWLLILGFTVYQLFLLNIKYPGVLGFEFPDSASYFVIPILGGTMADWGVCFPIGIVFSLNAMKLRPHLQKFKWVFAVLTASIFVIALLDARSIVAAPLARFISPIIFLFIIPVINRNSIPGVRPLEKIGKRSYGIYLSHLIILDITLRIFSEVFPRLFQYNFLLYPILFTIGLMIPISMMNFTSRSPARKYYRLIFG